MFKLSNRSLRRLNGVYPLLIDVVHDAIKITEIDFGVTEGVRSVERQTQLLAAGKTKTLKSKHIDGMAVDVVAYVDGKVNWEIENYAIIADAFKEAAISNNLNMRWGAAWSVRPMNEWSRSMRSAMDSYIKLRRSQGRRPFLDGPHFEVC